MNIDNLLSRRELLKDLGLAGTFLLLAYTGGCEQLIEIIENRPTRKNIDNLGPNDPDVQAYKAAETQTTSKLLRSKALVVSLGGRATVCLSR